MPKNGHLVKAMVFPVVMDRCENWTMKKAEHRRIDAFKLWCWRTLFRVPWTARKTNQSILKEINPEYSLEGLILKLKLLLATWCEELTLEKTLMLGKIEGKRKRGQQRMRWFVGITDSMNMNLSKLLHMVIVAQRTQKKMELYWSQLAVLLELSQRWSELGFWPEWPGGLYYVGNGVAGERQLTG